jgi:hypothetical protein
MNRVLIRAAVIAPLFAGLTLLPAGAAAAHDHPMGHGGNGDGNACSITGTVTSAKGLRYEPNNGSYRVNGVMDCVSKQYSHGVVTGFGNGVIGCFGGVSQAVLDIAWQDGRHSQLTMQTGDFAYGTGGYGEVTKGALMGSHAGLMWGRAAAGAEYACASDAVHSYEFAGGMGFHTH